MSKNGLTALTIVFVAIFLGRFSSSPVFAAEDEIIFNYKEHIAAVIVLDISTSMTSTDSDKVSISGAKVFVDLLETSGSKVAIITFSSDLNYLTTPSGDKFYDIDSLSAHEDVLRRFPSTRFSGQTDIGSALKDAQALLDSEMPESGWENSDYAPMILFFTDGRIDLGSNTARSEASKKAAEARESISRDKVYDVVSTIQYPIYAIGLNADSETLDKDMLRQLANAGSSDKIMEEKIVTTVDELVPWFKSIIKLNTGSPIDELWSDVLSRIPEDGIPINVPPLVTEMNITTTPGIRHFNGVFELYEPNSSEAIINSTPTIRFSIDDNGYSAIKIQNPQAGEWHLKIKSSVDARVIVDFNTYYKIDMEAGISQSGELSVGDRFNITGKLILADDVPPEYKNEADFKDLFSTVYCNVTDVDGTVISKSPMTWKDGRFVSNETIEVRNLGNLAVEVIGVGKTINRLDITDFNVTRFDAKLSVAAQDGYSRIGDTAIVMANVIPANMAAYLDSATMSFNGSEIKMVKTADGFEGEILADHVGILPISVTAYGKNSIAISGDSQVTVKSKASIYSIILNKNASIYYPGDKAVISAKVDALPTNENDIVSFVEFIAKDLNNNIIDKQSIARNDNSPFDFEYTLISNQPGDYIVTAIGHITGTTLTSESYEISVPYSSQTTIGVLADIQPKDLLWPNSRYVIRTNQIPSELSNHLGASLENEDGKQIMTWDDVNACFYYEGVSKSVGEYTATISVSGTPLIGTESVELTFVVRDAVAYILRLSALILVVLLTLYLLAWLLTHKRFHGGKLVVRFPARLGINAKECRLRKKFGNRTFKALGIKALDLNRYNDLPQHEQENIKNLAKEVNKMLANTKVSYPKKGEIRVKDMRTKEINHIQMERHLELYVAGQQVIVTYTN